MGGKRLELPSALKRRPRTDLVLLNLSLKPSLLATRIVMLGHGLPFEISLGLTAQ